MARTTGLPVTGMPYSGRDCGGGNSIRLRLCSAPDTRRCHRLEPVAYGYVRRRSGQQAVGSRQSDRRGYIFHIELFFDDAHAVMYGLE